MTFSEHLPSKQWAALKFRGEKFAEVWFKPEGMPNVMMFRIPQESFHIPGISEQLTIDNLLKAVALGPDEVESWQIGDVTHDCMKGSNPELASHLSPPPLDATHLEIRFRIRSPAPAGR